MAQRGVSSCAAGLVLLSLLSSVADRTSLAVRLLYGAAVCLGFTSATVVNALTAYASLQCDEPTSAGAGADDATSQKPEAVHPQLAKGKALGNFRSTGQLGRAIGPILGEFGCAPLCFRYLVPDRLTYTPHHIACASYWTVGPTITYGAAAAAMFVLSSRMKSIVKKTKTA